MVEISYKKHIRVNEERELIVCYNLISEGMKYDVECYVENEERKDEMSYCKIDDFTRDRNQGMKFVDVIAKGEVLPIHVPDIMEDYFA